MPCDDGNPLPSTYADRGLRWLGMRALYGYACGLWNGRDERSSCDDGNACGERYANSTGCGRHHLRSLYGTPLDCNTGTTSVLPCDDGNPATINDMQTVLDCDGSVCVPCMGTLVDCNTGTTSVLPCDDGNACTVNDMQTVLDADGTIAFPVWVRPWIQYRYNFCITLRRQQPRYHQ
ncbi:MAG: hypothetical protein R2795_22780 [Saprospiraceae bacterium]